MQSIIQAIVAQLRAWGMGERVIKTAVAVMLAWVLGSLIPGGLEHPYFAPLAALLSFQVTIAESLRSAAQRISAIVAGVILALGISQLLGVSVWSVGLITFLGLVVGVRLGFASQGVTQVAISGLIVLFIGGADNLNYAGYRIIESVVGAVVGVGINALVVPPSYLPATKAALHHLVDALADQLEALGQAIRKGLSPELAQSSLESARALQKPLDASRTAVQRAITNLKYHPLRRSQEAEVERYQAFMTMLEHNVIQVRSISRTVYESSRGNDAIGWAKPSDVTLAYATLLACLAQQLRNAPAFDSALNQQAKERFEASRREIEQLVVARGDALSSLTWMHLGALLASAERMSNELAELVPKEAREAELAD